MLLKWCNKIFDALTPLNLANFNSWFQLDKKLDLFCVLKKNSFSKNCGCDENFFMQYFDSWLRDWLKDDSSKYFFSFMLYKMLIRSLFYSKPKVHCYCKLLSPNIIHKSEHWGILALSIRWGSMYHQGWVKFLPVFWI